MALAGSSSAATDTGRASEIDVSISIRSCCWSPAPSPSRGRWRRSGSILLLIFVSVFNVAVLSPVVAAMERRLGWSRGRCSAVLVLGTVIVIGAVLLVLVQAMSDAVRGLSDDLPGIVDKVRRSDLGNFVNGGSGSLDTVEGACGRHHRRESVKRRAASSMSESPPSGRSRFSSRSSS